ncbi:hypothetical protein TSUD_138580 [Trifolium subterraneum]|uniref:Uncharacterized protein n=1 Tax=Trifolium subterraneum TaxID=3900 RepID=A0A2Z6LYT8_TRISU|nr:hypothetical protein TSUD_138580 [Trifolium subterraneum]
MELEKRKKKRVTKEDEEKEDRERLKQKLKSKVSKKDEEKQGSEVPTEEEVEEFYAILKRMKVVVKYFDDKGKGGREWIETLEKPPELDVEHGGAAAVKVENKIEKMGGDMLTINQDFDLNAVAPEAAESGGA